MQPNEQSAQAIDQDIFGLDPSIISDLVASAVGTSIASWVITERKTLKEFQGYAAEKILPVISYVAQSGASGSVGLFFKRMYGLDINEAHQYGLLMRHDIPVPILHGVAFGSKQEEIIVLELLEETGIDESDEQEVRTYIGALARLNAIRLRSEDPWKPAAHLVGRDLAHGKVIPPVLEDLWRRAANDELGEEAKAICAESRDRLPALIRASMAAGRQLQHMPRAIIHEDYGTRNTGWRNHRAEFVMFDLHRISLGPRFWDATGALGTRLAPSFSCLPWETLAQHYLDELSRWGGPSASLQHYELEVQEMQGCRDFLSATWLLWRNLDLSCDWSTDKELITKTYRTALSEWLRKMLTYAT